MEWLSADLGACWIGQLVTVSPVIVDKFLGLRAEGETGKQGMPCLGLLMKSTGLASELRPVDQVWRDSGFKNVVDRLG